MASLLMYFWSGELQQRAQAWRGETLRAGGVAFAKGRGEGVYHLFCEEPAFTANGKPVPAFIFIDERVQGIAACERWVNSTLRSQLTARRPQDGCLLVFLHPSKPLEPLALRLNGSPEEGLLEEVECRPFPGTEEVYARHQGLLATSRLREKRVALIGLGSFGAPIALSLAQAGVGNFVLIDPDRLEGANLSRHPCSFEDLGRFKTLAVRDALLRHNPQVSVRTFELDFNEDGADWAQVIGSCDLSFGLTDENRARFRLNRLALAARRPALFGRAITRAAGGDVFRLRPGESPCLACLFEQGAQGVASEISTLRQARRDAPAYMNPAAVAASVQPGLGSDIAPIVQMTTKLALLELMRGSGGIWQSLAEDLEAPFYIWANRREQIYAGWQPMGFRFDRNSILRWYGVRLRPSPSCLVCQLA